MRPEALRAHAAFDLDRIHEIEKEVRHDVIAFTTAVAETMKARGKAGELTLASLWAHLERCSGHCAGLTNQGSGLNSRGRS